MEIHNFQRVEAENNASVGRAFEMEAMQFLATQGIELQPRFSVPVGVNSVRKPRQFDLGSEDSLMLVECKSHTWTQGGNTPISLIIPCYVLLRNNI